MTEPKNEALINRIRKLLALGSEANPNSHEREIALTKAHELLAEHNLDLSSLAEKSDIGVRSTGLNGVSWIRQLTFAVAKLYYCESLNPVGSEEMCFLGTQENTLVATMMTEYLANSIAKEATIRYLAAEEHKDSFCLGAATTIRNRIEFLLAQERQPKASVIWVPKEQEKQNQLVHLRNKLEQANEKYMQDEQVKMGEPQEQQVNSWSFKDGCRYGFELGLERQLGSKETKRIGEDQ
jgi:hypothetical protein